MELSCSGEPRHIDACQTEKEKRRSSTSDPIRIIERTNAAYSATRWLRSLIYRLKGGSNAVAYRYDRISPSVPSPPSKSENRI